LVVLGLKINPQPFVAYPEASGLADTVAIPEDLPEPVDRFYRVIYGDEAPVIESFILSGRGSLRFQGITMPARLRFVHQAGRNYRHYIETTLWGIPILKVNENFIDWTSRLSLPFGVVENEPQVDQAANLGLWSETLMFPSVYLHSPGVHWESIDEAAARLVVPFKDETDEFTVYFNSETGLIDRMETLRWKEAGDAEKTLWQAQALAWGEIKGFQIPVVFAAQWMDDSKPWLVARIEDVTWNVDITDYILAEGP